ncbi:hypothetical protein JHK82_035230 [Glycine max]|uniref:Uncharacterized protein n=2 Tax=Glycine subgen. Soja TaxID=1462606 RepID=A0A0R0GT60_SOYBN|nr:hypothetical protein JHK85_035954 [Glycine max]RZB70807.1 hypothetical protein D0Y65_035670 [Glycine soja]KAG4975887.1 hypothetical protein JHK86_035361 [Glycine max]KAG5111961.1 hypothetical protein JHK82_035230 [Glycine max]KAG5129246.1 hypothetical protein JHK84_035643 [Glycine max]
MEGLVGEETISCNLFIIGANLRHIIVFFVTSFVASPRKGSFALKIYIFFIEKYNQPITRNRGKKWKEKEHQQTNHLAPTTTSTQNASLSQHRGAAARLTVAPSWLRAAPCNRNSVVADLGKPLEDEKGDLGGK